MAHQIIFKPDFDSTNEIIVWSTIVDRIIFEGDAKEWIMHCAVQSALETVRLKERIVDEIKAGQKPYGHWTMEYETAMQEEKEAEEEENKCQT